MGGGEENKAACYLTYLPPPNPAPPLPRVGSCKPEDAGPRVSEGGRSLQVGAAGCPPSGQPHLFGPFIMTFFPLITKVSSVHNKKKVEGYQKKTKPK